MTAWSERQENARLLRDYERGEANKVPCPELGCGAAVGDTCRNLRTGDPLGKQAAHDKRVKASQAAAEETQG